MSKQLTAHFNSAEFNCHDGTPVQQRDYAGLEALCRTYLEPMRKRYGRVTILSGYRTRQHNANVGGARNSYHVYTMHDGNDQAADIRCARGNPQQWWYTLNWLRKNKRNGRGGLGLYGSFCHIDMRDYTSNWRG